MISLANTIFWTEKLIAIAIFFQTLELIQLKHSYNNQGVWRWQSLSKEFCIFSSIGQKFYNFSLSYPNFLYLLFIRLFVSVLVLFVSNYFLILVLIISNLLISIRWRGAFNGGSDYFTMIILQGLFVATFCDTNPQAQVIALWYIAIVVCSSYFISGLVKIQKGNWRNGTALKAFLNSTIYQSEVFLELIIKNSNLIRLCSWIIIIFELSFPIALFQSQLCLVFVTLAFLFHLANFYIFGLNRFIFAWIASYPALYYCSQFFTL